MAAIVPGCLDTTASNYDPFANADCAGVSGGTDYSCCLYPGCTDSLAQNFDPTANIDDSSCTYSCTYYGLQDIQVVVTTNPWPYEVSWELIDINGTIVMSGGAPFSGTLCFPQIFGCTDPIAANYDSTANTDDGSCTYIYGCTDPLATNYDAAATMDDGSCSYPCFDASTYSTSFEDGIAQIGLSPSDWTNNTDDNSLGGTTNIDWIHDASGTGSSGTGPNYSTNYGGTGYAMDGAYYMYV